MGFWDRMDEMLNQGVSASREILGRAREKARELGEKGLLKWEISQLEKEARQKLTRLGRQVYSRMVQQNRGEVFRSDPGIDRLLQEIQDLERRIGEKEGQLKLLG